MENSIEKMKEIKITLATPEDARAVQDVFYRTWLATYPNEEHGITVDDIEDRYKDKITEEGIKKRAESMANEPEGHTLLLAREGDKVAGLCRVVITDTENRLQAIYVLPEYQGKGIGKKLWEEAKKRFDPAKDTYVAVATYNANAIEFYKKLGFEDTGKRWTDEKFKMKSGASIPEMDMIIKAEKE